VPRREIRVNQQLPLQNLSLEVLIVQPAQDWNRSDTANFLRLPKIGSISIQREMGTICRFLISHRRGELTIFVEPCRCEREYRT
jgi:hypothetical protein